MEINFPYRLDSRGRTAQAGEEEHLRQLIEQVLFTAPGERVNRPNFGCGLLQLVFAPIDDALAGALQISVHGALQQWLGDLIRVESVQVESTEGRVDVNVTYAVLRTQQRHSADFSRGI